MRFEILIAHEQPLSRVGSPALCLKFRLMKALARLHRCAGLSEPSLVAKVISTLFTLAGSVSILVVPRSMSILVENASGWVICHEKALEDVYASVSCGSEGSKESRKFKADFFNITSPYKMDSQVKQNFELETGTQSVDNADAKHAKRKRKRKEPLNTGEMAAVCFHEENKDHLETALTSLVHLAKHSGYSQSCDPEIRGDNNKQSRTAAAEVGPKISFADLCMQNQNEAEIGKGSVCVIENGGVLSKDPVDQVWHYSGDTATAVNILSEQFLLPARSCFLLSHLKGLQEYCHNLGRYSLIVMDPPWQNKSAKRKKMYWTMKNDDLYDLPIPQLAEDDCLIVVWATNKQAQHKFIQDCLFPAWKVELLAHWFWLKVTKSGESVCDLDSPHKKPYESILIGHCCKDRDQCQHSKIPNKKVVISVPCALHSKKPPLFDVLKSYLPSKPRCLELFARNLWPGWTSWGNEVLLHQHIDFFEPVT